MRHHHVTAATAVAVMAAFLAIFALVAPRIRPVAQDQVKRDAIAANIAAQSAPSPACNPGPGAGHMGSCAPVQALAYADVLGKAAGDPDDVRGLGPLGVDISNNNGCGFRLSGLGISFAYFKESEGTYYHDRCAATFIGQAKRLHLRYGVYHFLRARPTVNPRTEAAFFVHNLARDGALKAPLPPVVDVEVNDRGMGPGAVHGYVCAFLKSVRGYLHTTRVSIYTGNWFWAPQVGGDDCSGALLWDSAYAPNAIAPSAWRGSGISIWQYSDGRYGPTPHIAGVDSDVMLKPSRYSTAKPNPKVKCPCRNPRKLAKWEREYARVHAELHKHRHSKALRVRNRALHRLIQHERNLPA